jgi:hypothetical protein
MDVAVRPTSDAGTDGEIVWSCPPDAGVKPVDDVTGDGGNKARFTGESTKISR